MRGEAVRAEAYAKLTLSLRITGVRADGYHEIEALAISVTEPHDSLEITLVGGGAITTDVEGEAAAGVPVDATNLVARAARLARPGGGVQIHLHKRIRPGGGLGGGSADAAAVLAALASLSGSGLGREDMPSVAAALGADVPFCLGGGAAWMRGLGERIDPVVVSPLAVLLATPRFGIPTPAVYRAWDDLGGPCSQRAVDPPRAVAGLTDRLVNDLEPAAERVEPRLSGFRRGLEDATGRGAILAGSGSSCAVLFDDRTEAARAVAVVEKVLDCSVSVGTNAPAGVVLTP